MPKLSWTEMIKLHPAGHLVAGNVLGNTATASSRLVTKLIKGIGLEGDYWLTTAKGPQGSTIYCVFANKTDADQFSNTVSARPVGKYPGWWASQRSFIIDEGTRNAISDVFEVVSL